MECAIPDYWPWLVTGMFVGLYVILWARVLKLIDAAAALAAIVGHLKARGVYISPFEATLYNKAIEELKGQGK